MDFVKKAMGGSSDASKTGSTNTNTNTTNNQDYGDKGKILLESHIMFTY
jgi:hypothetical protein